MTKQLTIRDVAIAAGVATGTVSRVINGAPNVKPEVREKVETVLAALKFRPSVYARGMRGVVTKAIGCIVTNISHPSAAEMISGAEQILRASGYEILIANSLNEPDRQRSILESMISRKVDGFLLAVSDDSPSRIASLLQELNGPCVLWEREGASLCDSVATDFQQAAFRSCEYLIGIGHRRVLVIGGHRNTNTERQVSLGCERAFRKNGLSLDGMEAVCFNEFDETAAQATLLRRERPTAVIAVARSIPTILTACVALGLQIPNDVSLISLGDNDLFRFVDPPITAAFSHPEDVGRLAASKLLERIQTADTRSFESIRLPTQLILRNSAIPLKR